MKMFVCVCVCVEGGGGGWFLGWFLYVLVLLKIIFSMKRCYVGFGVCEEKCVEFVCVLFKVVKILKSIYVKNCPDFHYYTLLEQSVKYVQS